MKQYCRYCIHCHTGNGNWCDAKEREYSDSYFKRANKCKMFDFCEIDAFMENQKPYRPRETYHKQEKTAQIESINLFEQEVQDG